MAVIFGRRLVAPLYCFRLQHHLPTDILHCGDELSNTFLSILSACWNLMARDILGITPCLLNAKSALLLVFECSLFLDSIVKTALY